MSKGEALTQTWEEVVSELERATARLNGIPTEDFLEVAQAMNARSVAVARLREFAAQPSEPITPPMLNRLKKDCKNGEAIDRKLLLMRAAVRAEFSQAAEAGFMVRSLQGGRSESRPVVDWVG